MIRSWLNQGPPLSRRQRQSLFTVVGSMVVVVGLFLAGGPVVRGLLNRDQPLDMEANPAEPDPTATTRLADATTDVLGRFATFGRAEPAGPTAAGGGTGRAPSGRTGAGPQQLSPQNGEAGAGDDPAPGAGDSPTSLDGSPIVTIGGTSDDVSTTSTSRSTGATDEASSVSRTTSTTHATATTHGGAGTTRPSTTGTSRPVVTTETSPTTEPTATTEPTTTEAPTTSDPPAPT